MGRSVASRADRRFGASVAAGVLVAMATPLHAEPLVALAPPPGDDARLAIAIGPHGEVYAPDGKGAWTRTQRFTTADTLTVAGRASREVVAAGEGVVYKLADNGWSAFRLHQKDKAMMASGARAVAAVKRQLYALHLGARGEPEKLALAPAPVLAIGAGTSIVIATTQGLARVEGTKVSAIAGAPKQVIALVDDRWALLSSGAFDLKARKTIAWPAGAKITATTIVPGRGRLPDSLVAVATRAGKLELFTVDVSVASEPVAVTPFSPAVGVAVDRAGRVVIALADGRIAVRDRGGWTTTQVTTNLPAPRPGSGPASSP